MSGLMNYRTKPRSRWISAARRSVGCRESSAPAAEETQPSQSEPCSRSLASSLRPVAHGLRIPRTSKRSSHLSFSPRHETVQSVKKRRVYSQEFWRLDVWEDDSRRRLRFVPNPYGSRHLEAVQDEGSHQQFKEDEDPETMIRQSVALSIFPSLSPLLRLIISEKKQ